MPSILSLGQSVSFPTLLLGWLLAFFLAIFILKAGRIFFFEFMNFFRKFL